MVSIQAHVKKAVIGSIIGLAMLIAAISPFAGSSAYAQTATVETGGTTTTTVQDRDDDGFPWGLLGLLGLAGLAGLRPHQHPIERVDRTPDNRH
jgi:hypothetical protein